MARKFELAPAVRSQTPLLVGLVGPSGTGKTVSALRLAHGIQRVSGGNVALIDTEARRGLHYADQFGFKFHHLDFTAPFGPLDYLGAIDHCIGKGARVVVVDSFSHEWEGDGGVLDHHEQILDKMAGDDWGKRQACTFAAWVKPKAAHQELINSILQRPANFVFCFRAKEKLKLQRGKDPENRGYQIIGDEKFRFELTVSFFLHPGADGVPTWRSEHPAEQANMKIPAQFRELLSKPAQLSEDIGQRLAEWAAGTPAAKPPTLDDLILTYGKCATAAEFDALERDRGAIWSALNKAGKERLKAASDDAKRRMAEQPADRVPGVDEDPPGTLPGTSSTNLDALHR